MSNVRKATVKILEMLTVYTKKKKKEAVLNFIEKLTNHM